MSDATRAADEIERLRAERSTPGHFNPMCCAVCEQMESVFEAAALGEER